jgi:hypothetical protein
MGHLLEQYCDAAIVRRLSLRRSAYHRLSLLSPKLPAIALFDGKWVN